jgi:hypothetical protein
MSEPIRVITGMLWGRPGARAGLLRAHRCSIPASGSIADGKQYISFVDPKGIRNLGLTDPKIQFYETIKEIARTKPNM